MNQLELFGTAAPSPARRPAKPDTALLLAMSDDHAPASAATGTAPQPNSHGVYRPGERLALPRQVKRWQGDNLADIELLELGPHWIWATCYQLHGGDMRGAAQPLQDLPWCRAPSRAAAIGAAAAHLRSRLEGLDNADARRVLAWLDALGQGEML